MSNLGVCCGGKELRWMRVLGLHRVRDIAATRSVILGVPVAPVLYAVALYAATP